MTESINYKAFTRDGEIRFFEMDKETGLLGDSCERVNEKIRSIVHFELFFQNFSEGRFVDKSPEEVDQDLRLFLKMFGFTQEALERIYLDLGNGVKEVGMERLQKRMEAGLVTVERVGFSKAQWRDGTAKERGEQPKFYLMINENQAEGTFNAFHIGYSRRGTARAITRSKQEDPKKFAAQIERAEKLSQQTVNPFICRVKNSEPNIKVSELGGANLTKLDFWRLSEGDLWNLCMYLTDALASLHKRGLVHGDLKPENIVALFDREGKICGVRLIDLDSLTPFGKTIPAGTMAYLSPARLQAREQGKVFRAHPSDDIWAMMLVFCFLERSRLSKNPSKRGSLINSDFLNVYQDYNKARSSSKRAEERCKAQIQCLDPNKKSHFFGDLPLSPDHPLDVVVFDSGAYNVQEAPTAETLSDFFHRIDGKVIDFFENDWNILCDFFDGKKEQTLQVHVEGDTCEIVKLDKESSQKAIYRTDRKQKEDGSISYATRVFLAEKKLLEDEGLTLDFDPEH